jgi:phenylalanyl-tRNA synthetase beta chain
LPDQVDGLLLLKPDARVGQAFAEYLGRSGSDVIYDLEVTPNRPDLNSVIGIAREISALTGNPLKLPELTVATGPLSVVGAAAGMSVDNYVAVRIDDTDLCPRYTARIVQGVKVGASPDWLRSTLEKVGIRSISNVVDVTNFVMLEIGQPLHAFDYHLIAKGASGKPTIVVRRAADNEKFTTLDGQERTLNRDMLLIADETKGIALAGVMGGQNTEINNDTKDVLIESAYFHPTNIRRTSKLLGLRSESSYRFERGADVNIADWASRRAAQLILETAGGALVPGVVDAYPKSAEPKKVFLRFAKTDALLGIHVPADQQVKFLATLGLTETSRTPESASFEVPTFRVDIKREVDLIEEVVRLYGVDKVPSTPPRGAIGTHPYDAVHDELAEARRILSGLGLNEAQGQTLISDSTAKFTTAAEGLVALANPLSSDMNVLRPSLLPGLLDTLRHNLTRKNGELALFEVGRVFLMQNGQVKEERRVAFALTGLRNQNFWSGLERDAKFDVFDLKGLLEEFLEQFGMRGIAYSRRAESTPLLLESATIQLGKLPLGDLGQLLPTLAKKYDLRDPVLLAELNLDLLLAKRNTEKSFKSLPAFPSIRRDIAMLVPEATTHEAVSNVVRQTKPANLENVELFDVFRGKNVPEGQKSMAYAFTYRSPEKTLKDEEVNAAHERLVEQFKQKLQATIR